MAIPPCTVCEQFQGVLSIVNLQTGDSEVLCGTCATPWALQFAASVTEGMSTEEATEYAPILDKLLANDPRLKLPRATRAAVKSSGQSRHIRRDAALPVEPPILDQDIPPEDDSPNGLQPTASIQNDGSHGETSEISDPLFAMSDQQEADNLAETP